MRHDQERIADEIIRLVKDGSLPPDACANCSSRQAERRTLYAICARADRRWESRGGGLVLGWFMGIPFLLPGPSEETIEIREGHDVVVPVPLQICDDCWRELHGGLPARMLAFFSQGLFLTGLTMIVVWLISRMWGNGVSFFYAVGCLAAAIPFYFAAELFHSRWPQRIRRYLKQVPQYDELFRTYPNAEIMTKEPTGLVLGDNRRTGLIE